MLNIPATVSWGELQDLEETLGKNSWRLGRNQAKLVSHILLDSCIWVKLCQCLKVTTGVDRSLLL